MSKREEIAKTMRDAAELLNQYSEVVRKRVEALLESRRKKLEFEAQVKEWRSGK